MLNKSFSEHHVCARFWELAPIAEAQGRRDAETTKNTGQAAIAVEQNISSAPLRLCASVAGATMVVSPSWHLDRQGIS